MGKIKKEAWIILILVVAILLILFFRGNDGKPRDSYECFHQDDCSPDIEKYCNESGSPCNFTTYYRCVIYNDSSKCVPDNCTKNCIGQCTMGCENGVCINPQNLSDLIIVNITNATYGENVDVVVVVKNIGTAASPETTTTLEITNGGGEATYIDTDALVPGQSQMFGPFTYVFAAGTTHSITATADAEDVAEELREDNNEKTVSVVINPSA